MNKTKLHKYLDDGGTITFSASGVTFPCIEKANTHRQSVIGEMKKANDVKLTIVPEPDNPYDEYAMRIDWNEVDIGYVPTNTDFEMINSLGKSRRIFGKQLNKMLSEYDKPLQVKLDSVYGGYNGKHFGFSVIVSKSK